MPKDFDNILADLYQTRPSDREPFGKHYLQESEGVDWQDHTWHKIAHYAKEPRGDGQPCNVYQSRFPARFHKLVALPSENSIGTHIKWWTMSTGSGQGNLVADIAEAIASGMLILNSDAWKYSSLVTD